MSTLDDTRPGGWRSGWFLDCAPRSLICLSTGGGAAKGKLYFEFTPTYLGGGGALGYTFSTPSVGAGFAGYDTPLFNVLTDAGNSLSTPNKSIFLFAPTLPANGGLGAEAAVQGNVLGIAVDMTAKLVWVKNWSKGTGWNKAASPPQDPAAGTGGLSYGSNITSGSSLYTMGVIGSGQGGVPAPAAPTLTAVASAGAPGGTVYVRIAYLDASGGGLASLPSSITLAANFAAQVTAPGAPSYGTDGGYATFAGTSADACLMQNTLTTTASNANYQIPNTLVTGSAGAPYAKGTFNFGATSFTGTIPTGFSAWGATDTINSGDNSNLLLSNGSLTISSEGVSIIPTGFYFNAARGILKRAA